MMLSWLQSLWQDLHYAARGVRKCPVFAAIVVFSLALGIGANSTIFGVMNTVMYRPLPYQQPGRLMMIWETEQGFSRVPPPVAESVDWNKQNHVFEDIAQTSRTETAPFGGHGEPEQIFLQYVTPNFFSVLRVKPILGRIFATSEIQDLTQTIVISHAFWKRRFNADPAVLGKSFNIQGVVSTVVGIMPPGFAPFYGGRIDVWYPVNPAGDRYSKRDDRGWLYAFARLKPGVSRAQAQTEMSLIASRLAQTYPEANKGVGVNVEPLHEALFNWSGQVLYPLFGAVGFVLLIACVNVANLLLSRSETQRREHAVRASLGAGRRRLMQQLLIESGLLALLGGAVGVILTLAGIRLFRALAGDFPNADQISVDARVLLFTIGVSLLTAILFGSVPAILASRPDLNIALREGEGRTATGGRGFVRHALAIAEIALAMVLLVGAGLMINSVLRLQQVNPGFDTRNVTAADISLPEGGKYVERLPGGSMERASPLVTSFYRHLLEELAALPGVESAGSISHILGSEGGTFSILGHAASPPDKRPETGFNEVSPSFFRTLRIPLKKGRYLDAHDSAGTTWVAVINEAFARRYFPKEDPIGQRILIRYGSYRIDEPQPRQIVGIIGDVKQYGLQRSAPEMVYTSYFQQPAAYPGGSIVAHLHQIVLIRTRSNLAGLESGLTAAIKRTVSGLEPDQPVTEIMSMDRVLASSIDDFRFYMRVLGLFAVMAVFLAAMGIYGVMSYFVNQRKREIGIRMALGAQPANILGLIGKLGLKLTSIGAALGVALAVGLTHVIATFLFGVSATDPITFAAVAIALLITALLASYFPARRATKVDPTVSLRYE